MSNDISPKLNVEYRNISELQLWSDNPRSINKDAFERLKTQIKKLGVYKPLIVDQNSIVIGGNMRFRALTELGAQKVSVIVRECKDDKERLEVALSDNDRAGYYNETELAELVQLNEIDGELYSIDLTESKTIEEIVNAEPSDLTDNKEIDAENLLNDKNTCTCPRCGFEFDPKAKDDENDDLGE